MNSVERCCIDPENRSPSRDRGFKSLRLRSLTSGNGTGADVVSACRRVTVSSAVSISCCSLSGGWSAATLIVLVTTRAAAASELGPLRLQAAAYRREMAAKHIGLFGALRCRRTAQREGFDDVLFLNQDGTISEIATSNIGFVRGGDIVWPRSEWLTGITMTLLNQVLDEPIRSEPVSLKDLPDMEFAFATNAATGIRPVASVEDHSWPVDHPALKQLRDLYADIPAEQI